jgi:hypothetical protein
MVYSYKDTLQDNITCSVKLPSPLHIGWVDYKRDKITSIFFIVDSKHIHGLAHWLIDYNFMIATSLFQPITSPTKNQH